MVNLLIGNKNVRESEILQYQLANDKNCNIENAFSGLDTINMYWKLNPDILILDNNLSDISSGDIIDRLSSSPIERKKCNTILMVSPKVNMRLEKVAKINRIIYKPIVNDELTTAVKEMCVDYNTPDLEFGEIDLLLQELNFNFMSPGYKYMRDAIIYCYYRPDELEFLNNILKYLSYKYKVPESRVRDALNSSIRPFNETNIHGIKDITQIFFSTKEKLSLKDFLDRIVLYLIKTKKQGRIF